VVGNDHAVVIGQTGQGLHSRADLPRTAAVASREQQAR
jgi:hypothetical protein